MNPRRLGIAAILALLVLSVLWHLVLLPPVHVPGWLAASLHAAPLLPAVILLLRRHPAAILVGALAALFLFSHGVMEAWADPAARIPALLEIVLTLTLIFAASWNGLRRRFAKGPAV